MNKQQDTPQSTYFHIEKDGNVWRVDGQAPTNPKDMLDLMAILLTNAVRLALQITDINKSLKPMTKALTAQLKDIIKVEVRELREAQHEAESQSSTQEDVKDDSR